MTEKVSAMFVSNFVQQLDLCKKVRPGVKHNLHNVLHKYIKQHSQICDISFKTVQTYVDLIKKICFELFFYKTYTGSALTRPQPPRHSSGSTINIFLQSWISCFTFSSFSSNSLTSSSGTCNPNCDDVTCVY